MGLFDWKNELLNPEQVKRVASVFLGEPEPEEANDGWFKKKTAGSFDKINVTHSRIIIEQHVSDTGIDSFDELRKVRRNLEDKIVDYLKEGLKGLEETSILMEIFKGKIEPPLIYVYPLIILGRDNLLYEKEFKKDCDSQWQMPADLSTTCFFAALDDMGQRWPLGRRVYMRISGSSLIMGEASKHFTHRIINMLYYAGLYRMTRKETREALKNPDKVYRGLEPLLERQGEEITTTITQRTVEESLARINLWLFALTIAGVILAALSLLRPR